MLPIAERRLVLSKIPYGTDCGELYPFERRGVYYRQYCPYLKMVDEYKSQCGLYNVVFMHKNFYEHIKMCGHKLKGF